MYAQNKLHYVCSKSKIGKSYNSNVIGVIQPKVI
jgi:hypothetical protein